MNSVKQALKQLHQRVTVKHKPMQLAQLIKQGLVYEPPFAEAITFVTAFYALLPQIWMKIFSNPNIMTYLLSEVPVQYISILLKFCHLDPYELKAIIEKRYTKDFLSFQKEISTYKLSDPQKLTFLAQENTLKVQYVYTFAIKWVNLEVDVNYCIRMMMMLVRPTLKEHHDLLNLMINDVQANQASIRWEELYTLVTLKLCGGGNISNLFARMTMSSNQIANKLYPFLVNGTFPVSDFVKVLLNISCPTKVIEITECFIKRLAQDHKIKHLEDIFNNFCKPVLFKEMVSSLYYMEFDRIMRCLMEIPELKIGFTEQEGLEIMTKLNVHKPKEHLKLMEDIFARYSPQSKIKLQTVKESLLKQTTVVGPRPENIAANIKRKESLESKKQLIIECDNLIGLPNIGNSCYLNSFLVSMFFCPDFKKAMMASNFKDKSLRLLKEIYSCLDRKDSQFLNQVIFAFKKALPEEFSGNTYQQDAMEFGRQLLNKLMEEDPNMKSLFESKFTEVFLCGGGHMTSKVKTIESHLILNFPNPQIFASLIKNDELPSGIMLEELLKHSLQPVVLDSEYRCPQCNKTFNKLNKQIILDKLPRVLILCLARFAYNQKAKKILDRVLAKQTLKIMESNTKRTYKLVSFVNHMGGNAGSGHYQSYVQNHQQGWVNFDDDYLTEITVDNSLEMFNKFNPYDTPYILFYSLLDEK